MQEKDIHEEFYNSINPIEKKQTEIKMIVASRIDDIMIEKNITKKDFNKLIGKKDSRYFKGAHNFTLDTLVKISHILDIEVSELLKTPM